MASSGSRRGALVDPDETVIGGVTHESLTPIKDQQRRGVTERQARLIDWLKHPTGLPFHPAIDPVAAMWTAQEIVDHSGLYRTRAQALRDLNILRDLGTVTGAGGRWRYIRPHEDIRG